MFDKFIQQIDPQGKFTTEEVAYLRENTKIKFYKKGEEILRAGKIVKSVYFVIDGFVRLYYNVDGKDKTAFFYESGNFIWANKSLMHQIPTQKNYDVIENTVLLQIDKQIFYRFIESSRNFELITRDSKERELIAYQNLINQFITLSPEERFIALVKSKKSLMLRAPQQYIASYMGISAETLSRIKKRVYKNERNTLMLETY